MLPSLILLDLLATPSSLHLGAGAKPRILRASPQPSRCSVSLEAALRAAQPGDTILLAPGTYRLKSPLLLDQVNPPGRPITLRAEKKEAAILDGSLLPFDGSLGPNGDIVTAAGSGYRLQGLILQRARRIAVNVWGGKDIALESCTIRDSWRGAVYMGGGASHVSLSGCRVYLNCRINEKRDIPGHEGWPSAVNLGDYSSIVKSQVYENWGEGIGFYGLEPRVADNLVRDNFSVGIYACNVEGGTMERNFVTTTRDPRFFRSLYGVEGPAFGIAIANEGSKPPFTKGFRIQNNVVVGGIFALFYWRFLGIGGLDQVVISHNTFVGGEAATVRLEGGAHRDSRIQNNIFSNPSGPAATREGLPSDLSPLGLTHNLWWGRDTPAALFASSSILADPLLKGRSDSAASWRLPPSSPARGKALPDPAAGRDFQGRPRPKGQGADLGALQS